jgi:nicotinate-nucleotide adenylyltransferase
LKIGLLGGTFNPIHNGHLINAEIIREKFELDKILFIPAKYPVHKDLEGNVTSEDRFKMIRLAVKDNKGFDISRIEIDRDGRSYTIITLKQLLDYYRKDKLYLILGSDSFNEIGIWKDSNEILRAVPLIVMKRPGYEKLNKKIINIAKEVNFIDNPLIGISSSMIRESIKNNKSIKYMVPLKVEQYIIKKGLYQS